MTADQPLPINCAGEQLLLHHERAVHWPARRTLFVADVHFGKEDVFGRMGIAIPHGPSAGSLARLAALIADTAVERLCILGDFMHAAPRHDEQWLGALSTFLDTHQTLTVEVVAGNHDKRAGRDRVDARIRWLEGSVVDEAFVLRHEPGDDPRGYVLSGHIHPVGRIGDGGRKRRSLRAPAFWIRENHAVLPAFGDFTGGHVVRPVPSDRIYLAGPDCVIAVPVNGARDAGKSGASRPSPTS